jgi:hypothetical protein
MLSRGALARRDDHQNRAAGLHVEELEIQSAIDVCEAVDAVQLHLPLPPRVCEDQR